MNSKLNEKLLQFEKKEKITDDGELVKILEQIIEEEESLPPEERDADLIEEAVKYEVFLKYGDMDEKINEIAERIDPEQLLYRILTTGEDKMVKPGKNTKLKMLIPAAAAFLVAIVMLTAFSGVDNILGMARETFVQLREKIFYKEGDSDIVKTGDFETYQSIEEFENSTAYTNILLPHNLNNGYALDKITVYNYGVYENILLNMSYEGKTYLIDITIPNSNNYSEFETEQIGNYDVVVSEYDNIFQGDFIYKGNNYGVQSNSYENLKQIIENLEEKEQ